MFEMFAKTLTILSILTASISAAPSPCNPTSLAAGSAPTPTLPSTGSTNLPQPPQNATLKRIAVGHGIQNYTCENADQAKATAAGALAVLYDATHLYPGTPKTGLSPSAFFSLPSTILWSQPMPLNMQNASSSSSTAGAVADSPFPEPPTNLKLGGMDPVHHLGCHFFDAGGAPSFDLRGGTGAEGLYDRTTKKDGVAAPAAADKGVLSTGAVDWLRLVDDGTGVGVGISSVYRVSTAGGDAEACTVTGVGSQSVAYTAMYWFYD